MIRQTTSNDIDSLVNLANSELQNTNNELVCNVFKTYSYKDITTYMYPCYCQIYVKEVDGKIVGFIKGRLDPATNVGTIDFLVVELNATNGDMWIIEMINALAVDFRNANIPCSSIQGQLSAPELNNLLNQFNFSVITIPDSGDFYFSGTCDEVISKTSDWLAQHT